MMLKHTTYQQLKPVYRLFLLVFPFLLALQHALAQPIVLPFEHLTQQQFEAYRLAQGQGLDAATTVKPYVGGTDYLQWREDSSLASTAAAESWFMRKAFREHLIDRGEPGKWSLQLDPVVDLAYGSSMAESRTTWFNTRGASLQGTIGKKISFSSALFEHYAHAPAYMDSFVGRYGVMPGMGLARPKGSNWEYYTATSQITYQPSESVNIQAGQGRHFVGEGYRSMLLSDVAFPMPYVRLQAQVGPIHYTYWVMQMLDLQAPMIHWTLGHRQKYAAMSFLNWEISKAVQIGLFQSVVWQADDPAGRRPFPWQYLNPIIFFRPVQFSSGSEGNLLLGANAKVRLHSRTFAYGQLMLDELYVREFFRQSGAIINKYGVQLGIKTYAPAGIKGLFALAEYNAARPFTYSHWTTLSNYAHYNQPLAHIAGANFHELVGMVNYQSPKGWYLNNRLIWRKTGLDTAGLNFGSNIFDSYLTGYQGPNNGFGIPIGYGKPAQLWQFEWAFGRVLNPASNLHVELRYIYRSGMEPYAGGDTHWLTLNLRTRIQNLYNDF